MIDADTLRIRPVDSRGAELRRHGVALRGQPHLSDAATGLASGLPKRAWINIISYSGPRSGFEPLGQHNQKPAVRNARRWRTSQT